MLGQVNVLLHLVSNFHGGILNLLSLVSSKLFLPLSNFLCPGYELGNGIEIDVTAKMPEQGARDSDQRSVWEVTLPLVNGFNGLFTHNNLVEASFDETTSDVFDLFARLDEKVVSWWDLDGNTVSRVACPDVKTRVAGATMDGEEVEICVEAG